MSIRADEITEILKSQIKGYETRVDVAETGVVLSVGDGIARVHGLEKAMAGELLEFPENVRGIVLNLEEDNVGIALLGDDHLIKEGDVVRRTGRIVEVPVGDAMVGRVLNSLGQPIDGRGPIETKEFRRIEVIAPGIVRRQPVKEPLQTGIKAIDSMIPIGRGSASSSSATARRARPPLPSTPSSTRRARTSSAFTWPSVRSVPRWRRW